MNSGDKIAVVMHDTQHALRIELNDQTSGQSGFMVTSAANGFAQVLFDPNGTTCDPATHNLPYDFHPMYSTSSEKTHATWTAHSFNIGFSDEIGHFDLCTGSTAITPQGTCPAGNTEGGAGPNNEPTDGDDVGCFPASSSLRIQVGGCTGSNAGFDGQAYQPRWPDGNTKLHPTAVRFTSPLTGAGFNMNYNRYAFETDLPAVEAQFAGSCNVLTGPECTVWIATGYSYCAARWWCRLRLRGFPAGVFRQPLPRIISGCSLIVLGQEGSLFKRPPAYRGLRGGACGLFAAGSSS